MSSRMDKYYREETIKNTRTQKNKDIYAKINEKDLENLSLTSNISIISSDTTNLDIEKIKKILDEKYNEKHFKKINTDIVENIEENLEDTKEYDLNKIIENARKNKETNYDKERFEKNINTQYDILNELNINNIENNIDIIEEETNKTSGEITLEEETNLMDLIKTVNDNALKNASEQKDSDDLMSDLKGDDDTEKLEPIVEEEITVETPLENKEDIVEEINKTKAIKKVLEDKPLDDKYENTFYTGIYKIDDDDLEDFESLKKEVSSGNILLKILIGIIVLIILGVIGYFVYKNII